MADMRPADYSGMPEHLRNVDYLRIATEEAFAPPELFKVYRKLIEAGEDDPGFLSLWGFYMTSPSERVTLIRERLQDLGESRIGDMDQRGVHKQVLALTAPGVQIMEPDFATSFATMANDYLAEACRKYPHRFAGMAAVAPQRPAEAAAEIERAVNRLGMKAVIINSHTGGEYLDDPKFYPIFEAAEALDVPIYIHPNSPPRNMIGPMLPRGLDGAIFGFGVETGLHLLRIIVAGVFDRYPNLKIIVGHMGEALPFWLYRLEYMHRATVRSARYEGMKPIKKTIGQYLRENVYVTNSGVAWEPAITFTQNVIGIDRVLYAMDYPYQCDVEEVVALDGMEMNAADKKKFFQTNAERIFKL